MLVDSNRYVLVFVVNVINLKVCDDVNVGEFVIMVMVVDEDDGRNVELSYILESLWIGSWSGNEEDKFKWFLIDLLIGYVLFLVKLWCEFMLVFVLNIDVKDNGCYFFYGNVILKFFI